MPALSLWYCVIPPAVSLPILCLFKMQRRWSKMTRPASFGTIHPLDWTPIKPHPVTHTLFSELDLTPFVGPATALKVALHSSKMFQWEEYILYISIYKKESRKSQHRGQWHRCHVHRGCSLQLCSFLLTFVKIIGMKIISATLKQMSCQPWRAVSEELGWRIFG